MFAYTTSKRVVDVLFASLALVVTSPLILGGALLVRVTSPGPTLYRAKRAGRGGKLFAMLKLRTMRIGLDTPDRKITSALDDRITPVGALLRKFKIDELPQLWNVLRGDMSIVGPRPEDWDIVEQHYTAEQRQLLRVRPGIASPVDVYWYPDLTYHDPPPPDVSIQEWYLQRHLPIQIAEGLRYVERQNLYVDLQVIGSLVVCVIVCSCRPPRTRPLSVKKDRSSSPDVSGTVAQLES
jgi:lipopolysaccharide/colanic/teichoic acid biosynthesis glycosyltransferase